MRQNQADLYNETEFKKRFEARFPQFHLQKLNDYQKLDFAVLIETGEVKGFIEFKRRAGQSDAFDSKFLNSQKWIAMSEMNRATGLPCWLAYGYDDGDLMYSFKADDKFPLTYVSSSQEAVVLIPLAKFNRLPLSSSVQLSA
jgi:hypothetical protein